MKDFHALLVGIFLLGVSEWRLLSSCHYHSCNESYSLILSTTPDSWGERQQDMAEVQGISSLCRQNSEILNEKKR